MQTQVTSLFVFLALVCGGCASPRGGASTAQPEPQSVRVRIVPPVPADLEGVNKHFDPQLWQWVADDLYL